MQHIDKANGAAGANEGAGEEFLAFTLGREEYGIDILKVQEIRGYESVTQLANAPDYIKGVINLRGIIVPIVDLRIKFRQANVSYDQYTVVIIVDLNERTTGIVVDGVSDVLTLTPAQIKPTPHFSGELATDYIRGLGSVEQRMLILVDIEKLLNTDELAALDAVA
ncbi:Chemotaxis protein [Cupriavidus oxalaticus]|uniref:chemotaxis protein CheW n=1 Tax=Cupriavidus oxalaticus TaxID=96344 RepID=UPI003F73F133